MKTSLIFAALAALTLSFQANAKTLNAQVTPEQELCQMKLEIDPSKNVAEQAIKQLFWRVKSVKQIESSKGTIMGGGGLEGDYLTRVYIVQTEPLQAYPYGVYTNVTITQYGKRGTNELKGIEVEQDLLNYRNSAELAEDQFCARVTYK